MAEDTTVREGESARGADAVAATRSGIEDRLLALHRELGALLDLSHGDQSDAVALGVQRCSQEAERLRSALEDLESTLRGTVIDHADTVPGFRRRISGLTSLLGA